MIHEHQEQDEVLLQNGRLLTVLNLSAVTFCVMLGLSMVAPILPGYADSFDVPYVL